MSTSWSSYEPSESGDYVKSVSGYTTKSSDIDAGWPGFNISSSHSQHSEGQPSRHHMYVEPVYDAFVCPLTLQVMREPVTIENGRTFEKDAIEHWFQDCKEKGKAPVCPVTGMELKSTVLMPSLALQHIIEEWTSRTEVAQIENARIVLASNSSDDEMSRALLDMCDLCLKNEVNKERVRISGLIPFIADKLKNGENLRSASLATLRILATGNDDNKEAIGETDAIRSCFKCLSGKLAKEKEEAILLLAELAKHPPLCDKIGAVNGSILILVGLTSSASENVLVVEKAEETLDSLEASDQNMKQMAENGRLQPLLRQLVRGTDEEQIDLATYLADITLSKEGKVDVAKVASRSLVRMLDSETVAVEAGVLHPVVRDLFSIGSANQLPMKVKEISATILANVVNSDVDLTSLPVTLTSEDVIHSLLHLISNTGPAIEGKLLQVLVGLASSTAVVGDLVYSILSAGATSSLIQFLEAPQKEIRLNCVKLLHLVSRLMGQVLADGLRGTAGQLGVLVRLLETSGMTEEQAAAAGLLGNLPKSDISLTHLLLKEGALPIVARRLYELSQGSVPVGGGRYASDFKVGLATILCRFTYILDDQVVILLAQEHNLTALFTDLLKFGELEEIKRQSALALENLSNCSKQLSHVPEEPAKEGCFLFAKCLGKSSKPTINLCPVHGGVCSAKETFCLVEAQAVAFLGSNLDHQNVGVVEACLGALATLLHDATADREGGIDVLNKAGLIPTVLDIMKDHKSELLWRRSVWMVDRFLSSRHVAHFLSLDPSVHSGLVEAYRNGNLSTKQTAEKALKQLNKIPNFSAYVR
ncbi:hypothetical protein GOP47_0016225 [Adiantum capillus-veneris]|uniref:RING-type E3 ubiquitin transferase n=1 Tax=Adiantum capillus-veneris TaxID=13818 RepID=A0A9D4UHA2_ADICA|nr:hypothetical protein GOP47_0016225 [Adiantum capillus-veneris]